MAEIYVGTYAKYNAGNLEGVWLVLEEFDSYEEFMEAARKAHDDEADPELMFQVHRYIPGGLVDESHVAPEVWEMLDEMDYYAACAYVECFGRWDRIGFHAKYLGEYESWRQFAEELLEDTGELSEIPERLQAYFDYEAYARDLRLSGDIVESSGYYFWGG
jgi:antirestriction protein